MENDNKSSIKALENTEKAKSSKLPPAYKMTIKRTELTFYQKIRAILSGKKVYVAIKENTIRYFWSPSLKHAKLRCPGKKWVINKTFLWGLSKNDRIKREV